MIKDYEMLRTNEKLMLGAIIYEFWNDGKIVNNKNKFIPKTIGFVNCYEVSYYLFIMSNYIVGSEIAKRPYPILKNIKVSKDVRNLIEKFEKSKFIEKLKFISYFSEQFYSSNEFTKINLFKNLTEDFSFLDVYKNINSYLEELNN